MRISREAILWAILALTTPALAADPTTGTPKYKRSSTKTLKATVTAIDQDKRTVTVKGADGEARTFQLGKGVRNLDKVHVGDEVITQYQEALAVWVTKGDSGKPLPDPTTAEAATRAKKGEKPGGSVARTSVLTTTVTAIDKANNTVTLKGPEGNTVVVKVKNPKNLDGVAVGDTVTTEYSEALAIAVQPAGPKMPKSKPTAAPTK